MAADVIKVFEVSMPATETAIQDGGVDYTPATGRVLIIQGFTIYNANASNRYGNLKVGTTLIVGDGKITSLNTLISPPGLQMPLKATEKLYTKGEVATDLKLRLWGLECDIPA